MNSIKKWEEKNEDFIFFHDERPVETSKKVFLTSIEAVNIVNELSLHCKDEKLLERAELLKEFIKTK